MGHGALSTKYDTLVRRVIESTFDWVMFISLNYDLLLDRALERYLPHDFTSMDSYAPKKRKWCLIKPHGSVNWARETDTYPSFRNEFAKKPHFSRGSVIKVIMRGSNGYYVPNETPKEGPRTFLYPQLVIPADQPKSFACPSSHIKRAKDFIKDCHTFVFIGFSGNDDDIARLLEMMPVSSRVVIVSCDNVNAEASFGNICSRGRGLTNKRLMTSFHKKDFADFIGGDGLREILHD